MPALLTLNIRVHHALLNMNAGPLAPGDREAGPAHEARRDSWKRQPLRVDAVGILRAHRKFDNAASGGEEFVRMVL